MRRVMAKYPQGLAFTNDPGNYANVVGRDSAWFVYGCDHFMPEFSRQMLDNVAARQYASGKLPEYYDAVTGRVEDDGLNINDDTPLYMLAVNHHFRSTGDVGMARDGISLSRRRGAVYYRSDRRPRSRLLLGKRSARERLGDCRLA